MPKQIARLLAALFLTLAASMVPAQQAAKLNIDTTKTVHPVSPMLYGLMTEEINHSYDGGLYAQLLSNHTFRANFMDVGEWGLVRHESYIGTRAFAVEQFSLAARLPGMYR